MVPVPRAREISAAWHSAEIPRDWWTHALIEDWCSMTMPEDSEVKATPRTWRGRGVD